MDDAWQRIDDEYFVSARATAAPPATVTPTDTPTPPSADTIAALQKSVDRLLYEMAFDRRNSERKFHATLGTIAVSVILILCMLDRVTTQLRMSRT